MAIQNIPIRTPEGKRLRDALFPWAGKYIVNIDYSQIELRIAAQMEKDSLWTKLNIVSDNI